MLCFSLKSLNVVTYHLLGSCVVKKGPVSGWLWAGMATDLYLWVRARMNCLGIIQDMV